MMHSAELVLHVYEEIAEHYEQAGDAEQRDNFLLLAADAAFHAGYVEIAEQMRLKLLSANPYHMLRPYASAAEAFQSADVQLYVEDLLKRHPPERAPQLLEDLKERQDAAASRDVLFAELTSELDGSDLRVFQQYEDPPAPPPPAKKPTPPPVTAEPRRVPAPIPTLPVNLAPPAPWLLPEPEGGVETPVEPAVDGPELLDNIAAFALFAVAGLIAAAFFTFALVLPLLK